MRYSRKISFMRAEVMTWAAIVHSDQACFAAEFAVRLRRPLPPSVAVIARAWCTGSRRRIHDTEARLEGEDGEVFVLEVNPRASRTTPFVSKATGVALAKAAAKIMAGQTLAQQGLTEDLSVKRFFIKEAIFPFINFPGADTVLGPEMKSTGEVMGVSRDFGIAFAKAFKRHFGYGPGAARRARLSEETVTEA